MFLMFDKDTGPQVFEHAPLGLMIVTRQYEEEYCIAVSKVIDQVLRNVRPRLRESPS